MNRFEHVPVPFEPEPEEKAANVPLPTDKPLEKKEQKETFREGVLRPVEQLQPQQEQTEMVERVNTEKAINEVNESVPIPPVEALPAVSEMVTEPVKSDAVEPPRQETPREPASLKAFLKDYQDRFEANTAGMVTDFRTGHYVRGAGQYIRNTLLFMGGSADVVGYSFQRLGRKLATVGTTSEFLKEAEFEKPEEDSFRGIMNRYDRLMAEGKKRGGLKMKRDSGVLAGVQLELYGYAFRKMGKAIARLG